MPTADPLRPAPSSGIPPPVRPVTAVAQQRRVASERSSQAASQADKLPDSRWSACCAHTNDGGERDAGAAAPSAGHNVPVEKVRGKALGQTANKCFCRRLHAQRGPHHTSDRTCVCVCVCVEYYLFCVCNLCTFPDVRVSSCTRMIITCNLFHQNLQPPSISLKQTKVCGGGALGGGFGLLSYQSCQSCIFTVSFNKKEKTLD